MANPVILDAGIPTFVHATWAVANDPESGWTGVIHPLGATIMCGHAHSDLTESRRCIRDQYPTYNPYAGLHHPCNPECAFHETGCWREW